MPGTARLPGLTPSPILIDEVGFAPLDDTGAQFRQTRLCFAMLPKTMAGTPLSAEGTCSGSGS
jgi:hypothetical protein